MHSLLFTIISLRPWVSNRLLLTVFLILFLPLILLTTVYMTYRHSSSFSITGTAFNLTLILGLLRSLGIIIFLLCCRFSLVRVVSLGLLLFIFIYFSIFIHCSILIYLFLQHFNCHCYFNCLYIRDGGPSEWRLRRSRF